MMLIIREIRRQSSTKINYNQNKQLVLREDLGTMRRRFEASSEGAGRGEIGITEGMLQRELDL